MFAYVWPLGLIVLSNVLYQICAKTVSGTMNPYASLVVTYGVSAVVSLVLYLVFYRGDGLAQEFSKMNMAPVVLGIVLVGLEVGSIYAYKAGWQVSVMSIVQSAIFAVILIFVGFLLYHEAVTWNKALGILVCLAGLCIINLK